MHLNGGLAVRGGGEDLALGGRDGGVAVDQAGEHAAHGLNAQGQRGDVQQQHVLDVAGQHAALDGRADSDALVRVDVAVRLLAGHLAHGLLHGRDTGAAADQDHAVHLIGGHAGVAQRVLHRRDGAVDQIAGQLVELRAGHGDVQVLRAGRVRSDERQVDVGAHHAGELDLRLLSGLLEALHGHAVRLQINAVLLLELSRQVVDDAVVEVVAAQVGIAVGRQHLEHAVADLQQGDVEGAAAQVVHQDLVGVFLVKAVRQGSGGRLVDDAQHLQARDAARILGGLALAVREVRRHGDDRLGDGLAQVRLGVGLQLLKNHRGDVLRGVLLAVDGDALVGAHVALDGNDGAVRVGDRLALGHLAHQALAGLGERDDGRRGARALSVGDDHRLAAFHHGDATVRSTQVNTNNLAHNLFPPVQSQ